MIILNVPFSDKDVAKALGARWNGARKVWYVPDGQSPAPFERWHKSPKAGASSVVASESSKVSDGRVDTHTAKVNVGEHYIELAHDCSPFVECMECQPALVKSGWVAGRDLSRQALMAVK